MTSKTPAPPAPPPIPLSICVQIFSTFSTLKEMFEYKGLCLNHNGFNFLKNDFHKDWVELLVL